MKKESPVFMQEEHTLPGDERRRTYLRLIVEVSCTVCAAIAIVLFGGPVLKILLPFILAFIMAWAFNPVIAILQRHLRLTRKLFSYLLVLVFYAILLGLFLFFAGQVLGQVVDLISALPAIGAQLQSVYLKLATSLEELLELLPPEYASLQTEIMAILASLWETVRSFFTRFIGSAVGFTSSIALALPNAIIFLTMLILASCIITADFPNLRANIYNYLGARGKNSVRLMGHSFQTAVFGFFRSQLIFALGDMVLILIAFFIIGVPYPLPIALVLCFLDFIPFFGAGTVLVPWGLICIVLGMMKMGVQLLVLYGILYIIRRIFEPRVLGGATGFSSLQMLFSMYAGMQIAGVTGLVVAPIVWITGVNFLKTGILDGVYSDIRFVAADIRRMTARPVPTKTQEPPSPTAPHSDEKKRRFFHWDTKGSARKTK